MHVHVSGALTRTSLGTSPARHTIAEDPERGDATYEPQEVAVLSTCMRAYVIGDELILEAHIRFGWSLVMA